MPKGANQKLKLVYLMRIMLEKTDDEHGITMTEILKELKKNDITAGRKSIYDDFETIRALGIDIIGEKNGKHYYYHVGKREFEIAELKLLVDAIQSSKFITAKKSNDLIRKLEKFASIHEARQLQGQVYVLGRIKTMNESIYYNVDELHSAIISDRQVEFQYFRWNERKKAELRRDGAFYNVSPWALSWDNENYYLIGYDSESDTIKHFRVDKMLNIRIVEEKRKGKERFEKFDVASRTQKCFNMFNGSYENVRMKFSNELANVVIDRFGRDIIMMPCDEEHFIINVDVAVSSQFLGWVFALGDGVKIMGPENVVELMEKEVEKAYERYREEKT